MALAEYGRPFLRLDLREIYFTGGSLSRFQLYQALSQELSRLNRAHRLTSWLEKVRRAKIGGLEIQLDWRGASLPELLRALDGWASSRGERLILAIDEAQYLRMAGRTRYDGLLAWALDNLDHLTFVLTGSEVGLLHDFLGMEEPRSPFTAGTPGSSPSAGSAGRRH